MDAQFRFRGVLILTLLLLASCGGGGGDNPQPLPTPIPAPSGLSYSSPQVLTVGQAMSALNPTVTGTVTSYAASPALPTGLSLNTTSGVISGTPSAVAAATNYTVTATNSTGSTNATLSIAVNDVAPSISYGGTTFGFATGIQINEMVPNVTGGAAVSWSVSPALPQGLALNSTNGHISGTPEQVAGASNFVVTASNSGGMSQATLSISVVQGVLLELGHAEQMKLLRLTSSRALTVDIGGRWVLWETSTRDIIAAGSTPCVVTYCGIGFLPGNTYLPADLAGPTFVIATPSGFEVRASSDGHVLSAIATTASWWKLATDGSYLSAGNASSATAWSPAGNALVTRSGNYSVAQSFAGAGELRIANGAAGANVVETIALPAGTSSVSAPFSGEFRSWFGDGERFLTNVTTTVRTYSKTIVQQDIRLLPTIENLAAQGNWFWSGAGNLTLYEVGTNTTATYPFPGTSQAIASGPILAIVHYGEERLRIIDLSAPGTSSVDQTVPNAYLETFAANASGDWLAGNRDGVVLAGSNGGGGLQYLGYGAAWSISGSSARVAIATASGSILYFNANTIALEGTIPFQATDTELSSDGAALSAVMTERNAPYHLDRSVKVYSLPAGTETQVLAYTNASSPAPSGGIALSGTGTVLGQTLRAGSTVEYRVTAVNGPLIWSETHADPEQLVRLSPNGTRIAIPTTAPQPATGSNIVVNGALVSAVPAWAVGWIDDHRLLTNTYRTTAPLMFEYAGAEIYDDTGAKVGTPTLPQLRSMQPLTADTIYSQQLNQILSVTTGNTIWSSGTTTRGVGAVAGPRVFYASGARVLAEPR